MESRTSVLRGARWRPMACLGPLTRFRADAIHAATRRIARSEAARVTNGTVRWVRTTGELAAQIYRSEGAPPTGLVFIDGDHSYEALAGDWSAWSSLVAREASCACIDSRSTPEIDGRRQRDCDREDREAGPGVRGRGGSGQSPVVRRR